MKLDALKEHQEEMMSLIVRGLATGQGPISVEDVEDIVPSQMQNEKDVEDLCVRLEDKSYRRKLVCTRCLDS